VRSRKRPRDRRVARAWPPSWKTVSTSSGESRAGRRGGTREVADDGGHRGDALPVLNEGAAEAARPGAAPLALAGMEVHIEDADVRPVGLLDLEGLDLGVIDGEVRPLVKVRPYSLPQRAKKPSRTLSSRR